LRISPIPPKLAGEEITGDVGYNGWCDEWEIDPPLLRPEHRLDRFDGTRRLTGTGADACGPALPDPLGLS